MVKIRLQRYGAPKKPFYRIVAADSQAKRDGKFLEIVGTYDPVCKDANKQIKFDSELVNKWLKVGAQPTETVKNLIKKSGILNK